MTRTAPHRRRWLIVVNTVAVGVGVAIGASLHSHGVPIYQVLMISTVMSLSLLAQLLQLATTRSTTTYRCPTRGCDVQIRVPGTSPRQARHWQQLLATDHTQHAQP